MSWEEREPRIWWMGLKEGKTKSFEKKIVEMKPKQNLDIYREGQERCDRKGMQKHPSCTRKTKKNNKKTFLCTVECSPVCVRQNLPCFGRRVEIFYIYICNSF